MEIQVEILPDGMAKEVIDIQKQVYTKNGVIESTNEETIKLLESQRRVFKIVAYNIISCVDETRTEWDYDDERVQLAKDLTYKVGSIHTAEVNEETKTAIIL